MKHLAAINHLKFLFFFSCFLDFLFLTLAFIDFPAAEALLISQLQFSEMCLLTPLFTMLCGIKIKVLCIYEKIMSLHFAEMESFNTKNNMKFDSKKFLVYLNQKTIYSLLLSRYCD